MREVHKNSKIIFNLIRVLSILSIIFGIFYITAGLVELFIIKQPMPDDKKAVNINNTSQTSENSNSSRLLEILALGITVSVVGGGIASLLNRSKNLEKEIITKLKEIEEAQDDKTIYIDSNKKEQHKTLNLNLLHNPLPYGKEKFEFIEDKDLTQEEEKEIIDSILSHHLKGIETMEKGTLVHNKYKLDSKLPLSPLEEAMINGNKIDLYIPSQEDEKEVLFFVEWMKQNLQKKGHSVGNFRVKTFIEDEGEITKNPNGKVDESKGSVIFHIGPSLCGWM